MGRVSSVRGMAMALCVALGAGLAARPAGAQDVSGFADQVLTLVNKERQAVGLAPLTRAPELDQAAQQYAQYMGTARFFDHTGPDGSTPPTRIAAAGYKGYTWGENIAAGQPTPDAVMKAWMNSSGHRANILHSAFKEIGIGVARVPGSPMGIYWVQDFGARNGGGGGGGSQPAPAPALPSISGINPNRAKVGDTVAIDGSAFGGSGKVMFAGGKAGGVQSWSTTKISVKVPDGAQSGLVTVQNSAGTSNGIQFQVDTPEAPPQTPPVTNPPPSGGNPGVTPPPTGGNPGVTPPPTNTDPPRRLGMPKMSGLSPRSGKSGVLATIKGKNFGNTPGTVLFGRTGQATVQSWTNTEIKVVLTAPTPGWRLLRIVRADGVASVNMALFATLP
jgi:Cysteine-rich secretory protein family